MVVLQKSPTVFLVALFVRGFWLEVTLDDSGTSKARYLHGTKCIATLFVGSA
ncbi:MAG: hypothetical protein HOW73_15135 [Polyangiaceae bacterium]|nr:hypothetical protein [Polyangiaceae bacterium]